MKERVLSIPVFGERTRVVDTFVAERTDACCRLPVFGERTRVVNITCVW